MDIPGKNSFNQACLLQRHTEEYAKTCRKLKIPAPCRRFMESLTLRTIEVSYQSLSDIDVKVMLITLQANVYVKNLVLRGNRIGDKLAQHLFRFLKKNSCIQVLDLSQNELSNFTFVKLGEAVEENSTLTELSLSGNGYFENWF